MVVTLLGWCLSVTSWADIIEFKDAGPQAQPHQLQFDQPFGDDEPQTRAMLLPDAQQVTVANRLILEAAQPLRRDSLPPVVGAPLVRLELLVSYSGRYVYLAELPSVRSMLLAMAALAQSPLLHSVQPDLLPLRKPLLRSQVWNAPVVFDERQFRLGDYLPLQSLWQTSRGKGVKIAVIDSGINPGHPALQQMPIAFQWDVDANTPGAEPEDNDLHGTWVAGLIWARPELVAPIAPLTPGLAWGIAPEAGLIALKLRRPWTSNLLRAFALAEQQQADVINISWLLPWVAAPVRDYLGYLVRQARHGKGILIVAAADPQFQPNLGLAALDDLLVVTSTDHRGVLANCSWDKSVDLAAISYILSVSFRAPVLYERFAKTSASAPVVAGLAALLRAVRPDLTAHELQLILVESGAVAEVQLPGGQAITYKKLDAQRAYQRLLSKPIQHQ